MGYSTRCSSGKIVKLVKTLTDGQIMSVIDIGFEGLLKINFGVLPKNVIQYLISNFNPISRLQRIGSDKYYITRDDVYDSMCLPISDVKVVEVNNSGKGQNRDMELRLKWEMDLGADKHDNIPCDRLLCRMSLLTEGCDFFKKYFLMYVLCTFLAPTSRSTVDFNLLRVVESVNEIKNMDWCGYVLKKFCDAVERYNKGPFDAVNGCVFLPLMCYLYRFSFQGIPLPTSLPLVQHFNDSKVKVICKSIVSAEFDACVMSSNGVPLTSMGKLKLGSGPGNGTTHSTSCFVVLEIPDDLPTDEKILAEAPSDVVEHSMRFARNIEIVTRSYVAEMMKLGEKAPATA